MKALPGLRGRPGAPRCSTSMPLAHHPACMCKAFRPMKTWPYWFVYQLSIKAVQTVFKCDGDPVHGFLSFVACSSALLKALSKVPVNKAACSSHVLSQVGPTQQTRLSIFTELLAQDSQFSRCIPAASWLPHLQHHVCACPSGRRLCVAPTGQPPRQQLILTWCPL